MKFGEVPITQAVGKILAHNLIDAGGHKKLSKGHLLTEADLTTLRQLGLDRITVATLEAGDLSENEAAARIGKAIAGNGIEVVTPGVGRANLVAQYQGPLVIDVPLLERINNIDAGITVASLHQHTLVKPQELVALVKVIPFAISEARVIDVEHLTQSSPVLAVRPLPVTQAALIVSGPDNTRERLLSAFESPVRQRLEQLNSQLSSITFTSYEAAPIAEAIQTYADKHIIILTGISAIIDQDDIIPTALRQAGGSVTHFGVPVDPGSLLMLGYLGQTPVLGAPSCIKSLKTNVIDWLLPRLLAGERLTRADLVALGHGGLLEDISDRPMPRNLADQ